MCQILCISGSRTKTILAIERVAYRNFVEFDLVFPPLFHTIRWENAVGWILAVVCLCFIRICAFTKKKGQKGVVTSFNSSNKIQSGHLNTLYLRLFAALWNSFFIIKTRMMSLWTKGRRMIQAE